METRTVKIKATDTWPEKEIIANLINGDGWKGFCAGIGSNPCTATVQITVRKEPS